MSVTPLRPLTYRTGHPGHLRLPPGAERVPIPAARPTIEGLGAMLLRDGLIDSQQIVTALALHARRRGRLSDVLLHRGLVGEGPLYLALSRYWGVGLADLAGHPPDTRLIDRLGATDCIKLGLLPWRQAGGATVVATAHPDEFERCRPRLSALFGPVVMALAPARAIEAAVLAARGPALAHRAETRVAEAESCRTWNARLMGPRLAILGLALAGVALVAPLFLALVVAGWAILTLAVVMALRLAAALTTLLRPRPPEGPPAVIARLPVVSVMVALYRESDIGPRLVRRLGRLDYPRELLDILLVVEEDDSMTREALDRADLPPWMRVIVAPEGHVKTKPRALNFALDHCHGSIVGVYDAEDAPDPGQIRHVVERFHQRGPDVACLQGVLDFYNPHTNWLSRCFTIEYATWFRLILPGIERLGLPVPLGGTTLFFRRPALEALGAWDAWNVTEDADLGLRLARHGYRTELIETVTEEEANCRALPWVKQRSRWIKGYMMTWLTHMRDPVALWRQLGTRRFIGVQVLFAGTISQALLAPVLWSFWLTAFGLPHPVADALPTGVFHVLWSLFIASEACNIAFGVIALRKTSHRMSPFWVPTLHFYNPLGTLAAYKAAQEVVTRPFYWDKTSHGHFDG